MISSMTSDMPAATHNERPPLVSVIIPARNQADRLPALLNAFDEQTVSSLLFEVIIVDDLSTDGTPEIVESLPGFRLVRLPSHGGPYIARNAGIAAARGRLLAFTDADCTPKSTWIEAGIAALEDRTVDIVVGHIEVNLSESPSISELIDYGRYLDQRRNAEKHNFGGTGNLWVRREILPSVGQFNDRLLSGGDKEFCQRAVALGAKLTFGLDVANEHPPCNRNKVALRRAFRIGYGVAQFRYYTDGPTREYPHVCLHPGAYVPTFRIFGLDRIERSGYIPSRRQRRLAPLVDYVTFTLPLVVGNIAGTVRHGLLGDGRRARREIGRRLRQPPAGRAQGSEV